MIPDVQVTKFEKTEEIKGNLASDFSENKLMRSVLENDKKTVDDGRLISCAINLGVGSFTPDIMFQNLVKDYSIAEKLYGEVIIRQISGYDPDYVSNNIHIPEFKKELQKSIAQNIKELHKKNLIDENGCISQEGLELAALSLYVEELDKLLTSGVLGSKLNKKGIGGDRADVINYKGQRFRDIAIRKSIRLAARRGRSKVGKDELKAFKRKGKGQIFIIYAIDASGSMRGEKLEQSKKAGIALSYAAIEEKDKVGLIVFGDKVKEEIEPTLDFVKLIRAIAKIRASNETDIAKTIKHAIQLFPDKKATKHLIILTDALPTKGDDPENQTLDAASLAISQGITISLVGIKLDEKGEKLSKKIVEIGEGRLYAIRDLENIDKLVLQDYYMVA